MSVKIRKRKIKEGYSYYLDIYWNGNRTTETTKFKELTTKDSANKLLNKESKIFVEQLRAKRELEILTGTYGLSSIKKRRLIFIDYMKELSKKRYTSKSNYDGWLCAINHVEAFLGTRIVTFESVNSKFLEDIKSYLLDVHKTNTASSYFNKVRATINQAFKDRIIIDNPCEIVSTIKTQESEREYLTHAEVQKLWDADFQDKELKRAFIFSCYTGLRFSDIEKLTWNDIKDNKIKFRPKKTTEKFQYLPLNNMANRILDESDKNTNNVFNISYSRTSKLEQWCRIAGINKHITFHCSRHTFATMSLTAGADIYVIKDLLGHSKVQTTQIYTKIINSKTEEAVNLLPNLI